jgi:hypothetical protein
MPLVLDAPINAFCLLVVLPLLAICADVRRRQVAAAHALGLRPQRRLTAAAVSGALLLAAALLALAATRPALHVRHAQQVRTDAEAYIVVDTSVSMLARPAPAGEARIERAGRIVHDLTRRLPSDVPIGLAAMPQGLVPLLAPTHDRGALLAVAASRLSVGAVPTRPILDAFDEETTGGKMPGRHVSTSFDALATLALAPFFDRRATRRVVLLVTDAESGAFDRGTVGKLLGYRGIKLVAVRAGDARDRLWLTRNGRQVRDAGYSPLLEGVGDLAVLATSLGGHLYREDEIGEAASHARSLLDEGPRVETGTVRDEVALGPYLALASLPLAAFALAPLLPGSGFSRKKSRVGLKPDARR